MMRPELIKSVKSHSTVSKLDDWGSNVETSAIVGSSKEPLCLGGDPLSWTGTSVIGRYLNRNAISSSVGAASSGMLKKLDSNNNRVSSLVFVKS
jgi:hypothetical protein